MNCVPGRIFAETTNIPEKQEIVLKWLARKKHEAVHDQSANYWELWYLLALLVNLLMCNSLKPSRNTGAMD
jgi:uncharacterized membrane protein (DUF106 family)